MSLPASLADTVFLAAFHALVPHVGEDKAGTIGDIAENVTRLVLKDQPLMIAPRLVDDRATNEETLQSAVKLGAKYVLVNDRRFFFFAAEENLNAHLRQLGLPNFGDPEPKNSPTGPCGVLDDGKLYWYS